jgi:precorrin-2 dehydrogenase / sirohydrochlorin ferrochelatase
LLPILLNSDTIRVGLAGAGDGYARRAALLVESGVEPLPVALAGPLPAIAVLFIAGIDPEAAAELTARARAAGILVNAEDIPELCDFHVPAIVRRGDLVLTVSTGGQAPALARRLREWLEGHFGPEWKLHLEEIGTARAGWRASGLPPQEISRRTRALVSEKGWLQ